LGHWPRIQRIDGHNSGQQLDWVLQQDRDQRFVHRRGVSMMGKQTMLILFTLATVIAITAARAQNNATFPSAGSPFTTATSIVSAQSAFGGL
jgi:hypothetical protein